MKLSLFAVVTLFARLWGAGLAVIPSSVSIAPNTAVQFATSGPNGGIVWSVNGITGGSTAYGTVSATGLYRAPSATAATTVTVRATSAHPSKTAQATVRIIPVIAVSISPSSASLQINGTQQFAAAVTGTPNAGVTWSVNGSVGGSSTVGTISTTGLYSASSSVPSGTITVAAVSSADMTKFAQAVVMVAAPVPPIPVPPTTGTDQYGGLLNLQCSNGPKPQFYTQKVGSRWLLCTPEGHGFFFQGVSHIDYNAVVTDGGYSYQTILQAKYSGDPQAWQYGWADNVAARIKSWFFNAIGDSSSIYVWPWGSGSARTPSTKLPVIPSTAMSFYSFTNNGNYAPGPTKSLMDAIGGSAYKGWVGRGLPDVYDPNYDAYVNGRYAGTIADAYWSKTLTSPWSLGFSTDESDDVFGLNGPGPEAPNPPDGVYHPHAGYIVLAVTPTQASSAKWGVTYSDTTVYSKLQLQAFLQAKYGTIDALNASWQSNYTTFGSAGGWPKSSTNGTGLMDEDGSGSWLGDTAGMLFNATPGVVTDLDAFLLQWSRKYFSIHRTRFKQYSPTQLMFCPMLNNHDGLTRKQVLQAAGEYCDVIQAGADTQALLDKTALYAGDHPIMHGFVGTPANPDSALWHYPNPAGSPASTQAQRGTVYNTAAMGLFNNAVTTTSVHPVIGFTFWEWADNWNDNGSKTNWGLVSSRDNAYDGLEAVSTPNVQCQAPQQVFMTCGGEDKVFGNFLDAVRAANAAIWQALAAGK